MKKPFKKDPWYDKYDRLEERLWEELNAAGKVPEKPPVDLRDPGLSPADRRRYDIWHEKMSRLCEQVWDASAEAQYEDTVQELLAFLDDEKDPAFASAIRRLREIRTPNRDEEWPRLQDTAFGIWLLLRKVKMIRMGGSLHEVLGRLGWKSPGEALAILKFFGLARRRPGKWHWDLTFPEIPSGDLPADVSSPRIRQVWNTMRLQQTLVDVAKLAKQGSKRR